MKFSEFKYQRPNQEQVVQHFNSLLDDLKESNTLEEQNNIFNSISELRSHFESMAQLAKIRHTIDTTDEFYKDEQEHYDQIGPVYQGLIIDYYQALNKSRFKPKLAEKWGNQLFSVSELMLKTFSSEIIEDLQLENKLTSQYTRILASAKINFEGEERNLAQLVPFQQADDRDTRKKASAAKYDFFKGNEQQLDKIYDKLVQTRTKIARQLGFENFIELGYARLSRTDYGPDEVAIFREEVLNHIVPLTKELKKRQAERLGLDALKYYDDKYLFKSGNPLPKGEANWIVANAQRMYQELSPETGEFFDYMLQNELMDLMSKKGKAGGGYCTFLSQFEAPFIFSNFNGTSGDIDVLTHEAGHAFQVYSSRKLEVPEYYWPTLEAAEIHSMGMEFLAWPWMNLFFAEDTEKYKFMHLSE
ncbi:MAG: M3 family oligoendopeptidase, partial [Bacillota bacterium]|nr:M3 family oligoendopeptidase [Bacillota bacterium]